jgi:hypothetical protein
MVRALPIGVIGAAALTLACLTAPAASLAAEPDFAVAVRAGTPSVSLAAQCGPAAPTGSPACNQAQSDLASEEAKLRHKADILQWYPMVSLGIGFRF